MTKLFNQIVEMQEWFLMKKEGELASYFWGVDPRGIVIKETEKAVQIECPCYTVSDRPANCKVWVPKSCLVKNEDGSILVWDSEMFNKMAS